MVDIAPYALSSILEKDVNMRKNKGLLILIFIFSIVSMSSLAHAVFEWTLLKQIELDVQPLDIAASEDGKLLFILSAGELIVYTTDKNKVENRIPIDQEFDRVTLLGKAQSLVLSSTSNNKLRILQLDQTHNIDISGLPFKGPVNAPVTIAAFDDYQ